MATPEHKQVVMYLKSMGQSSGEKLQDKIRISQQCILLIFQYMVKFFYNKLCQLDISKSPGPH